MFKKKPDSKQCHFIAAALQDLRAVVGSPILVAIKTQIKKIGIDLRQRLNKTKMFLLK